jgi:zinc and cadmium transporter
MSWFWLLLLPIGPLVGTFLGIKGSKKVGGSLAWFLSFAGAYLLGITILNLIPEVFRVFDPFKGALMLLGFFFQIFLERYSEGVEHGHMHAHHHLKNKVLPLGVVMSLSIHSIAEGVPLGALWLEGSDHFFPFLFGIMIHEVPAAFALLTLLKGLNLNESLLTKTGIFYSMMSFAGAILSVFLESSIPEEFFEYFMAFVIGTFLHISTTILFENSEHHIFNKKKLSAVLAGISVALMISLLHSH